MLSRFLHKTPATPEERCKELARNIKGRLKPRTLANSADVNVFVAAINELNTKPNGDELVQKLLTHLAFSNTNTSYIEPLIEAAYTNHHPDKEKLGALYSSFAVANQPDTLIRKMLDDRFYRDDVFPVHALSLLGAQGVRVPGNNHMHWMFRALKSSTDIKEIAQCAELLQFDVNFVSDVHRKTVLHEIMLGSYTSTMPTHLLERAKVLGVNATPDIFGRFPDMFGSAALKLTYHQYFPSQRQTPVKALASYLERTLHESFGGITSIGPRNTEVYVNDGTPIKHPSKTTLFEHILRSNDMEVVKEAYALIAPRQVQHDDIERTFASVFLERFICGTHANVDHEFAHDVFALLQKDSPLELSTALGHLLMRSDAYYKNYDVNPSPLTDTFVQEVSKIMQYQTEQGLTSLLKLERDKLVHITNSLGAKDSANELSSPQP